MQQVPRTGNRVETNYRLISLAFSSWDEEVAKATDTHILLLKELGNPTESWSGLGHITPTVFDKFLLINIIFL